MNNKKTLSVPGRADRITKRLVMLGVFTALIFLMAFVPNLGYIQLGVIRATIIHIPVILGCLLLGPKAGAYLGFVFGLTSFINNTINPTITSFVFTPFYSPPGREANFWSLVICFVPRILVGVLPFFVYRGITRLLKTQTAASVPALLAAGVAGALTNTILVMHFIYLFFGGDYARAAKMTGNIYKAILAIIVVNGLPEALIAGLLVMLIGKVLLSRRIRDGLNL